MISDIYFDPHYGKLYEKIEDGKAVFWKYEGEEGEVIHQFILRKIPSNLGCEWFDIVTPYGYGGPLVRYVSDNHTREQLVEAFHGSFEKYCKENNIVSEFVRFHPIFRNADDFKNVYDVSFNRYTRGTNLCDFDDPINEEFSKSSKKIIRQLLRDGVSWKITESPSDLEMFKKIYYATMDRHSADEYYYFDDLYFEKCLNNFGDHIILVEIIYQEKIISAAICFTLGDIIHVHLSGTLPQYLNLSPAYLFKYCTVLWGKERGYKLMHHGGGKTADEQDPLYLYKQRFSKNTKFEFYIGKKIWNRETYDELCRKKGNISSDYFPLYRA